MQFARAVHNLELVFLEEEDPAGQLAGGRFLTLEKPSERTVVDDQLEGAAQDIASKLGHRVHHGHTLELSDGAQPTSGSETQKQWATTPSQ